MVDNDQFDRYLAGLNHDALKQAMEWALAQRNFEIELYWKRVTYFWAFVAVAFAGYFSIVRDQTPNTPINAFVVSCLGGLFTLSWYWASRGASYWHISWDIQVKKLAGRLVGPLFHAGLRNPGMLGLGPYRVSVTAINEVLSLYILCLWMLLAARAVSDYFHWVEWVRGVNLFAFGAVSLAFCVALQPWCLRQFRRQLALEFDDATPRHVLLNEPPNRQMEPSRSVV